ncbi:NrfD/PsrC family molybdoenzyme membrane anchor subunit [Photobacterium lipolyticum]|uniref:Cytochrome c nitrite reductase subunit NrfD n=1 Tax=Photobacterium lipolyticum TaxID=266810 RepID=A0A2T3N030_9GAMM|nr:NrfD/PsrC family molybdoenzyme membrane anchor subunit [Photobacterium lipolyticum]PSW05612.1 cytochrome c nitrite reductase subunit NrfD [Photobacterium lipolyticum]
MIGSLNNAFHFDTLVWHWPIAIYLFVLGVSSGAMCLALAIKHFEQDKSALSKNPLVISAVILAASMVILGLLILIVDLTKPLDFWKVIVYQFSNPQSVMGRGVTLFILYQMAVFAWIIVIFKAEILRFISKFSPRTASNKIMLSILAQLERLDKYLDIALTILSILLGMYTGFLLSALVSYPMLNQPILPLLFLASGISSGIAASVVMAYTLFSANTETFGIALIHRIEKPVVIAEVILLMMLIIGMRFGVHAEQEAINLAVFGSFWAYVFWIGVIGIGIVLPLFLKVVCSDNSQQTKVFMVILPIFTLMGVMSLRMFILYAGQMVVA